ncbi:MAG: NAD(+) diphosphatase [Rhodobacteraceae bacterium]|nr:NAD(+) diphosphatase [Paracoccaceae bacterium]
MDNSNGLSFADSGLDRAAHLRGDAEALARAWSDPAARVLALWRCKPLVRGEGAGVTLAWMPTDAPGLDDAAEAPVFLGCDDGVPRFALDLSAWQPDQTPDLQGGFLDLSEQVHPAFPADCRFAELRGVMSALSPRDGELAATARALAAWHGRHRFCANCGAASDPAMGGWQRKCPACGAGHFPRTDPVVIMLITRGDRVLLGRSPGWPDGMYSLLAGFIEPGETIEAAVRREVLEEAGIRVGAVQYLASQPWPFPASLMLACRGEALSDTITIDPEEIEDALWLTREDLLTVYAGTHPTMRAPRQGAIAGFVLERWLGDRLEDMPR